MEILFLMILSSITLEVIFLIIFIININNGQFDDNDSQSVRMLIDD